MKSVAYILILLLFACNKPNQVLKADTEGLVQKNGILYYKEIAYTGKMLTFYPESTLLKSEKQYVDGLLDGKVKSWHVNRMLKSMRFYSKGLKTGKHNGWWENGNKKFTYEFNARGQYHGAVTEWFENGTFYKKFNYSNGKEDGAQQLFYQNGNLRANYVVVQGERFGLIGLKKCNAVSLN